jgi:hypothetical protein
VPADSDVVPGTEEPDPAEVEGDEGEEVDVSHPPIPDASLKYQRETLDQRLAEEEPDRASREEDPGAGDDDDESAEEAAVHIRDEDRI